MENLEYEIKYQNLNVSQLIKNKEQFDYDIIEVYISEYSKGFKVSQIGKTHGSGTIFTYEKIHDAEEAEIYIKVVIELIKKYNNKYAT
ncbi:hypothetical protein CLPUN_48040 [Clostridium puniceum]|uniref:Uncharacterized protein n=1 Tax=Clostridium puniceum TaxID=29367 RepID=A0A1S8T3I7_9CLOT|nr:hypothetical protein [Clostridium puniceum]OOM72336.1 hypothetical protein CLPUN_48040 [Clostridium puniceum]